jgi:aminopeptidase
VTTTERTQDRAWTPDEEAGLARLLVHYSATIQKGDVAAISSPYSSADIVFAMYRELVRSQAHGVSALYDPRVRSFLLMEGRHDQLEYVSGPEEWAVDVPDVRFSLLDYQPGPVGSSSAAVTHARSRRGLRDRRRTRELQGHTKSILCAVPSVEFARSAQISLGDLGRRLARACLLDRDDPIAGWSELAAECDALRDRLRRGRRVRIRGAGTKLDMEVDGDSWVCGVGRTNMPDGEVYGAPRPGSVSGNVLINGPVDILSTKVVNISLEISEGRIVQANASSGEDALQAVLSTDYGAQFIGEVGIGVNPEVDELVGLPILDEKLRGSYHLAIGASVPGTAGQNASAIHIDLTVDTHAGGSVTVGSDLLIEDGGFRC